VEGHQEDVGANRHAGRACGRCRREWEQGGEIAIVDEVVLREPDVIIAELLREHNLVEGLAVEIRQTPT
jgi:hypothetical protein